MYNAAIQCRFDENKFAQAGKLCVESTCASVRGWVWCVGWVGECKMDVNLCVEKEHEVFVCVEVWVGCSCGRVFSR